MIPNIGDGVAVRACPVLRAFAECVWDAAEKFSHGDTTVQVQVALALLLPGSEAAPTQTRRRKAALRAHAATEAAELLRAIAKHRPSEAPELLALATMLLTQPGDHSQYAREKLPGNRMAFVVAQHLASADFELSSMATQAQYCGLLISLVASQSVLRGQSAETTIYGATLCLQNVRRIFP